MKQIFILLAFILVISSCRKEHDIEKSNPWFPILGIRYFGCDSFYLGDTVKVGDLKLILTPNLLGTSFQYGRYIVQVDNDLTYELFPDSSHFRFEFICNIPDSGKVLFFYDYNPPDTIDGVAHYTYTKRLTIPLDSVCFLDGTNSWTNAPFGNNSKNLIYVHRGHVKRRLYPLPTATSSLIPYDYILECGLALPDNGLFGTGDDIYLSYILAKNRYVSIKAMDLMYTIIWPAK